MRIIEKNGIILAKHIESTDIKEGLNFFSEDNEFLQVGSWVYESGKELQAHIHNLVERKISRTHEVLCVLTGSLEAVIYDLEREKTETLIINSGDVLMLMECGHGYRVLQDGTRVIEIKNGPYPGAEADRYRI